MMVQQNFSADKTSKLENEFAKTMCPSVSVRTQLAKETGLTEKQIKQWFDERRSVWKICFDAFLDDQCDIEENENALQKYNRQQTEFKHYQLSKLKNMFVKDHFPDIFMIKELAKETGLTEEQIEKWFKSAQAKYSRHNNKEHQSLMMLKQNTAVAGAKVCVDCGQRIVHQTVPQSQPNANAIDITSVGCTSVSAVRGRAKCRHLFWRAVTFPVNAIAKLVKKVRSAKCALANKVKRGKNEKK
ncbi:hypothetical protein niasHS_001842 [Heterodera schachtii]|uniref:Homeobox domain-containing protein n=1 Tax=Heterodera schachtii TaxID=97005 RepID=A0ABD2KAK9_HETSC